VVRGRLGDDNRLVRIYGSDTTIDWFKATIPAGNQVSGAQIRSSTPWSALE